MTLRISSVMSAISVAVAACSNPPGPAAPIVDGVEVASQSAPLPPGIQMLVDREDTR
jgi:hypothetical protein